MNNDGVAFLPRDGRCTPPGYKKILFCDPEHPQYESDERLGQVLLYKLVPADYDETQEALNEGTWEHDDDEDDDDDNVGICHGDDINSEEDEGSLGIEYGALLPPKEDQALSSLYFGDSNETISLTLGTLPIACDYGLHNDATLFFRGPDADGLRDSGTMLGTLRQSGSRDGRVICEGSGYGEGNVNFREGSGGCFSSIGSGCDTLATRMSAAEANFWTSASGPVGGVHGIGSGRSNGLYGCGGGLCRAWDSAGGRRENRAARVGGAWQQDQESLGKIKREVAAYESEKNRRSEQGKRPRRMKFAEYIKNGGGRGGLIGCNCVGSHGESLQQQQIQQHQQMMMVANGSAQQRLKQSQQHLAVFSSCEFTNRAKIYEGVLEKSYKELEEEEEEASIVEITLEEMPPDIRRVFEPILEDEEGEKR
ncbi:uncharacterized protein SAPINGB_P005148 [Magnusiomyces paraingens]|uniref:Uncharacterized protein n=1 Tax=Magnusiomyces paraingens TaxID=2606893 RepID=A0A5E8BYI5_9ASCO|nr:uncharacterized protein SAPINGB_P005148 [Saprochaete ingens]VVT56554.1 unnamed protein product [Saprochaete ingens]